MNYEFSRDINHIVNNKNYKCSDFVNDISFLLGRVHKNVRNTLWNLIDSHDTARFITSSKSKKKLKFALALQMVFPGMPMIYYGDEYGMTGGGDPDCRRGMVWDEKRQDQDMYKWYRGLIKTRKENPALTEGEMISCITDDESGMIDIVRRLDDTEVRVIFNGKNQPISLKQYSGMMDKITGEEFDGELLAYSAVVI